MKKKLLSLILFFLLTWVDFILAGTILGSKHDLSNTNFYGPMGGSTQDVCVFCHTPHGANTAEISGGPLWNRTINDMASFVMYGGAGSPNYITLLCLSCHDGVANEGDISAVDGGYQHVMLNTPGDGGSPNCGACHPFMRGGDTYPADTWRIGPILTNDHPVSIDYSDAVASNPAGDFKVTPDSDIKLFDDKVECATCHDPHNPDYGLFLRKSNAQSALCQSCHQK